MTHNEYEHYRRRLDQELEAGLELLRAAHAQQVKALELVYRMGLGEGAVLSLPSETAGRAAVSPRQPSGTVAGAVAAVLPALPEIFNRRDVLGALGYDPGRSSLYRALESLVEAGTLRRETDGKGRNPTRYKKSEG